MSAFIDLTGPSNSLSTEELSHLLSEVERTVQQDPRSAKNVLQLITAAEINLIQVDRVDAERRLRKVACTPLHGIAHLSDREEVKRICRDLINTWG